MDNSIDAAMVELGLSAPPPPADDSLSAVIQRGIVTWDEKGVPVLSSVPMIAKTQFDKLAVAAASLPYKVDPTRPGDEEFEGKTNAEVMFIRQARAAAGGDDRAREDLLDRVLGKPKQSMEKTTLSLTYEDTLRSIAASEKAEEIARGTAIETTAAPTPEPAADYAGESVRAAVSVQNAPDAWVAAEIL